MESIGFTHKIYIDFSGDDGDPRIMPGASKVICAAWIMIAPEEISYNLDILREVKKIVGCRQDCELKYVSLKNHPRKRDSLRLLSQTKAKIVIVPVLKEYIKIEGTRDPKTKSLIWFLHFFPLGPMLGDIINKELDDIIYPQLIFDELKWKGCETHIKTTFDKIPQPISQDNWILFDSFNRYPLLQLADIFSGLGAEFMESLQDKDLTPCRVCLMAGKVASMKS